MQTALSGLSRRIALLAVVTPARDEARTIGRTIDSVLSQELRPTVWVIVDDGSRDATADVVADKIRGVDFVRLLRLERGGGRAVGAPVVRAFRQGLESLDLRRFEFVAKLDADIVLPREYFRVLLDRFEDDPSLGIAGGTCFVRRGSRVVVEKPPPWHVRGALKCYRRSVYEKIGPLPESLGWDTADEVRAMVAGWKTKTFPDLLAEHQRATASASGLLRGRFKQGLADHALRTSPWLLALRCLRMAVAAKPPILGAASFAAGYLAGALRRQEPVLTPEEISLLRRLQWMPMKRRLGLLRDSPG